MRTFSKIVSIVFHPLLMPFAGLILLFFLPTTPVSFKKVDALYHYPDQAKFVFILVVTILTLVATSLSILIMRYNKMISNLSLENRHERIYPYVLVLFYFFLSYLYLKLQTPPELRHPGLLSFAFGMVLVVFISLMINQAGLKISQHATGIFGLCGGILAYNQTQLPGEATQSFTNLPVILILFIVAGMVSSARIYLGAHSFKEILAGIFVGFFTIFGCVKFGFYL